MAAITSYTSPFISKVNHTSNSTIVIYIPYSKSSFNQLTLRKRTILQSTLSKITLIQPAREMHEDQTINIPFTFGDQAAQEYITKGIDIAPSGHRWFQTLLVRSAGLGSQITQVRTKSQAVW